MSERKPSGANEPEERTTHLTAKERAELAAQLVARRTGPQAPSRTVKSGHPLAHATVLQSRMFHLWRGDPSSSELNQVVALRLEGPLDVNALEASFRAALARHRALVTGFAWVDDHVEQIERAIPSSFVEVVDVSDGRTGRSADEHVRAVIDRPFDLEREIPVNATVFRLSEQEHCLVWVAHHIAADGHSLSSVFQEIATDYEARVNGTLAALPPAVYQAADFAAFEAERFASGAMDRHLRHWEEQLRGSAHFVFPKTTEARAGSARILKRRFPEPLVARLQRVARELRATPFVVLLTAFSIALAEELAIDDFVLVTAALNRTRGEFRNVVGLLANLVPIRCRVPPGESFERRVEFFRGAVLDALSHQELPYESLVRAGLAPQRCDIMFLPFVVGAPYRFASLRASLVPGLPSRTPAPLQVFVDDSGVMFRFDQGLLLVEVVERIEARLAGVVDRELRA